VFFLKNKAKLASLLLMTGLSFCAITNASDTSSVAGSEGTRDACVGTADESTSPQASAQGCKKVVNKVKVTKNGKNCVVVVGENNKVAVSVNNAATAKTAVEKIKAETKNTGEIKNALNQLIGLLTQAKAEAEVAVDGKEKVVAYAQAIAVVKEGQASASAQAQASVHATAAAKVGSAKKAQVVSTDEKALPETNAGTAVALGAAALSLVGGGMLIRRRRPSK
jgi:LPXTG-motif cell wall-anchored protein